MPKIILGDNPFFAISHLSPEKSAEYLRTTDLHRSAINILASCCDLGIDLFMVSTHSETPRLLKKAGYGEGRNLPKVCLVVPNVHEVNKTAATRGITGAVAGLVKKGWWKILVPRRLYQAVVMADNVYPEIEYVALHNVVVDMLLGLRAHMVIGAFCWLTKKMGYKPVLITLNPLALLKTRINCAAICCYYNAKQYNVCDSVPEVLNAFNTKQDVDEIWAMGVVASGAVTYQELAEDKALQSFDRVLVASSKLERIKSMKDAVQNA